MLEIRPSVGLEMFPSYAEIIKTQDCLTQVGAISFQILVEKSFSDNARTNPIPVRLVPKEFIQDTRPLQRCSSDTVFSFDLEKRKRTDALRSPHLCGNSSRKQPKSAPCRWGNMAKTALVILGDGFEEIEAISPIDILRRADVDVCVAGLTGLSVKGRSNITVTADVLLQDAQNKEYDCVVVPGGPGTKGIREDGRVLELVKKHHAAGKLVCAICAAPTVLHAAGVLGSKYTAHASVADVLPSILPDKVVVDGKIITSTGAGTSVDFGLCIVRELVGQEKSDSIAKAIAFS
jgi:4-methyl-5(b-hydroxyethyl)-thiazole monophosphate biosynthesis